ncbi:phage antirepressor KilAC domain-containing protein [uncultured Ilyobacter sp.]|uniref:phage antirepressor KilAC domain-containing protein n=1 Tax=uncultured Ilyobacter sp. TaxID=544433 RepID=UPI0029C75EFD|nr:phage antirepressor KilAC domain-containing protein [uncultured Ilyobacter sp.]
MEFKSYNMDCVTDHRALEIISKVGSLAMIGEIGATKNSVADFFEVSPRTIERILKENRNSFLMYGEYKKSKNDIQKQVTDKFVGTLLPTKTSNINLFNRKHIMLFACNLGQTSDVAKSIIQYLIQVESNASKEDKVTAVLEQLIKWNELPSSAHHTVYMNAMNAIRESKGLIAFAESVSDSTSLVSVNDFAKSNYETLGLGQKKLFSEMRIIDILDSQNKPYQYYINMGYFSVITRVFNSKIFYQPMLTGKGQVWLLDKMKYVFGKIEKAHRIFFLCATLLLFAPTRNLPSFFFRIPIQIFGFSPIIPIRIHCTTFSLSPPISE